MNQCQCELELRIFIKLSLEPSSSESRSSKQQSAIEVSELDDQIENSEMEAASSNNPILVNVDQQPNK